MLYNSTTNSVEDTNVCGGFTVVHALSADEHKHGPARIRYSNKVLYTMFRTTHRLRTDVLSFVGCQNSANFKLASLGMRGAQERALLVSDDNIGTYSKQHFGEIKNEVFFKERGLLSLKGPVG